MGIIDEQIGEEASDVFCGAFSPHRTIGTDRKGLLEVQFVSMASEKLASSHREMARRGGAKWHHVRPGIDAEILVSGGIINPGLGSMSGAEINDCPMRRNEVRKGIVRLQKPQKFVGEFALCIGILGEDLTKLFCWDDSEQ